MSFHPKNYILPFNYYINAFTKLILKNELVYLLYCNKEGKCGPHVE